MKHFILLSLILSAISIKISAQDLTLYMEDTITLCEGDTATLEPEYSNTYPIESYLWSTNSTTDTIHITKEGEYILTLTDSVGNKISDTTVCIIPDPLEITFDITEQQCYSNESSGLSASPEGGYFSGRYVDNTALYFRTDTGASHKNYTYTVYYTTAEDNYGCTYTDSTTVTTFYTNIDTIASLPTDCSGDTDGSITLELTGGVEPYDVLWSNGQTGTTLENIPGNTNYEVTITDAISCSRTESYEFNAIVLDPTASFNILSNADTTAPYSLRLINTSEDYCSVEWTVYDGNNKQIGSSSEDNPSFVLPEAGTYNIELYAWGGGLEQIHAYQSKTVNVNKAKSLNDSLSGCDTLSIEFTIEDNVCAGENKGSIIADVSGGTAPYRYLWSTTKTNNTIENLSAGYYSLTATDINGCKQVAVAEIADTVEELSISQTISVPSDCSASDGSIKINVTGGVAPYTYTWSNGYTQNTLSDLPSDDYTVTVEDSYGCTLEYSITLWANAFPQVYTYQKKSSNCNKSNGFLEFYIYDQTDSYINYWEDSLEKDNSYLYITSLSAGDYTLTLVDTSAGCSITKIITIEESIPEKQEICMVTVSPETEKNIVTWEPVQTMDEIDYYTIYKENEDGEYYIAGTVSSGDLSVFRDDDSSPEDTSTRYRISATNYCGNESELSSIYKTMNMQTIFGSDDDIDLIQDFYEGEYIYTYNLYASLTTGYSIKVASLNAEENESWINTLIPDDIVKGYYMQVELNEQCNAVEQASDLKSDSGPFSQSLSNISEAELSTTLLSGDELILTVSPNPSKGTITIAIPEAGKLSIFTVDGKPYSTQNVSEGTITLDNFSNGIYLVKLFAEREYYSTFIIE